MASSSLSSSPPSSASPKWKYDVFPSFHGADVRKSFLRHMLEEFNRNGVTPFFDNDIKRSKSIGPELVEAIRGSKIAVVLLSKNYASSTWCMNELVEIMKCRDELGQTVLTIFYQVDSTDVKKQTGDFGMIFRKTCEGKRKKDIRRWRQALVEAAKIAGYHSDNWDCEATMINKIATDISNKLNNSTQSSRFDNLVGMRTHMEKMGLYLRLDLDEVRMIGIWGPPGIGKTAIARFLFNQHFENFQLSGFMEDIKTVCTIPICSDDYNLKLHLQQKFLSQIIKQKDIKIPDLGVAQERLKNEKVLVVLDDVDQLVQLDAMAKENSWFGHGSRIIITTQDLTILKVHGINNIYKMDFPSSNEALQIFCMYAFEQKSPKVGFENLAWEVMNLAGQLPLGLRVMGSYFRGLSKQEWKNALPRLRTHLDGEIESILKYSYDALCDDDKKLFLHIACLFNYEEIEKVQECLAESFANVKQGLDVLVEKSLIYMEIGQVRMHVLLAQLGRDIVHKQSIREPGQRQFLVDRGEISKVLVGYKTGGRNVIGINLSFDETKDQLNISERVFERMSNLQFLRLGSNQYHTLYMPRGLNHLSQKLRLLDWNYFPMTCLLEKSWEGFKSLGNLKLMDLSYSVNLKELCDFSTATNLQELNLSHCSSLVELPSTIGYAINLQKLNLKYCSSLVELPSTIGDAINLQNLNLSHCSSLVKLSSSIGNAFNLQDLILTGCLSLLEIPSTIGNAISLKRLVFNGCSSLVELPSSIGNLHELTVLKMKGCSKLKVLPVNINLKSLWTLDLTDCSSLKKFPEVSTNIEVLKLNGTAIEQVPSSIWSWHRLDTLVMSYCVNLKDFSHTLDNITEFDTLVRRFSCLRRLVLEGCKKLLSLPKLPDSLTELVAKNCESLERLDCSFHNPKTVLDFSNCFKLNKKARDVIIQACYEVTVLPGREIPAYFTYRTIGGSLIVKLDEMPFPSTFKFKVCILLISKSDIEADKGQMVSVHYRITDKQNSLNIVWSPSNHILYFPLEKHLYIFEFEADVTPNELFFEFGIDSDEWVIKECGVHNVSTKKRMLFYGDCEAEEEVNGGDSAETNNRTMDQIIDSISKYTSNSEAGCSKSKVIDHFSGMGFDEEKEDLYTSEGAFKVISNRLPHAVYICCEDTLQYSFASHLSLDFRRKGIAAFVNCNGTLDVIEEASASVIVFSKSCFSSTSCLDKLVRVLQCRRKTGQLVVPVFYGISPSDVVVQEHELADQIRKWSSVLQELRELPGHQSREECDECELVEEIVKDVYEKLFPKDQIGINSRLLEIEQLLCKQPWDIRRIGIWGMPGIGKTTLAKAYFDQISGGYEASCFIKHFDKTFHEKGLHRLLEEHFGKILKELPRVWSSITRPSLPKKRTLVVLDDVHNPLVAESFLGRFYWFGPGSLIIIISRDKQVFRLCQIKHVYEVQSLKEDEALQLFSQYAFGKNIREQKLLELSGKVIDYANGNPLALIFYGRELKGKKLSEMETTFLKHKLRTPYKIHDLFKSSYETLNDSEKNIFLDIACFFNGENVDYVKPLFEGCGFSPHVGIDVLAEKCLVTVSENRVKMHRIIQDFGREIINGETVQIERRRRLWEPWTIKFLLEDDELEANGDAKLIYTRALGTEDIKGIFLDAANLRFDVKPTAFEDMLSLRLLSISSSNSENISGLRLPKGLESLPYELRLLHWEHYPLRSLPQEFEPSHLVELDMCYSQLQKLWGGTKNLDMLRRVRLRHSQQLTEIDDICKAQNIELIDLEGCTKLQSFPAIGHLQHLRFVKLSACREIKSFPEVSPNIEELDLQGTGIRELPISIGKATNLQELCLSCCSNLVELPSSIGNATNLEKLNLGYCSSLVKLPSSIGNATNLKELYLTGCSKLVELPISIGKATNLEILDLSNCSSLKKLPSSIGNASNLQKLNLRYCSSLVNLPKSIGNATNLKELYLTKCSRLVELPASIGNATNLKELYLTKCSRLVELPASIGNATNLETLDLSKCSSLKKLPSSIGNATSLQKLILRYCSSLVELPPSIGNAINLKKLFLTRCSSLVELPSSIGNLTNLQELNLEYCSSLVELPPSIGNAINLKKLFLTRCSSLVELPSSIGNLTNLQELNLEYCSSLVELPPSIGNAINLKKLFLTRCSSLVELPSSIGNLTNLQELNLEYCSSLVELPPSIGNAINLKKLFLTRCSSLVELPSSIGNLTNLQELNLEYCSSLVELPPSIGNAISLMSIDLDEDNMIPTWKTDVKVDHLVHSQLKQNEAKTCTGEKIDKWREALKSVPKKLGFTLSEMSDEGKEETPQHQVFINFRGKELRKGFVNHLEKALKMEGINVFIDKDETKGNNLSILFSRIEESRIALAIFSSMYTESVWCLNELEKIKECVDLGKLVVIPIFYKVETDDVINLKGVFGDKFWELAKTCTGEKLDKWREALKDVPQKLGFTLGEMSDEGESINQIVGAVRKMLRDIPIDQKRKISIDNPYAGEEETPEAAPDSPPPLFGMETRLKQLEEKLDSASERTFRIGVVGMPGIGKTTLTKMLYEKWQHKFLRCVFLHDVHEMWKDCVMDRNILMKELLKDDNVNEEFADLSPESLKALLLNKKSLVVLDNVSDKKQIEVLLGEGDWIKKGSLILITTSDRSVIEGKVDDTYEVLRLSGRDSLHCFSYYAFSGKRKGDFMNLSKEFADYAKGNPLALKILGGELKGKGKTHWEEKLRKLAQSSNKRIEDVLRISYDELGQHKKVPTDMIGDRSVIEGKVDDTYEITDMIPTWKTNVRVEDESSNQEAEEVTEPVSLEEEEEKLRQELEEIEAKYQKEMKEIARKREAIMETKRKLR